MIELYTASFPTLAYFTRRRVEQLIQEPAYRLYSSEMADVIEDQLIPALKALEDYEELNQIES